MMTGTTVATLAELAADAAALASGGRSILGIAGAPGAGKSTLAEYLEAKLAGRAVLVPMDGFHLANEVLERLGRLDRKGSPDTFDAAGYAALLRRLATAEPGDAPVYAPRFVREIEESIASSIPVPAEVPLVITEGNYLLLEEPGWAGIRSTLTETWFVEVDEADRQGRLILRHESFGRSPTDAAAWALGTDQRNAELVAATAARADRVIRIAG